jgi:hypothetical protein
MYFRVMRVRAGTFATLCCVLLAWACAPSASAADPYHGVFATDMSNPAATLAADMNAYARTGAGTLREHLFWDRIERWPGVFDWSDTDAMVAAAQSRGMTILPVLVSTPAFYSTRPAGSTGDGWPPRDPAMITRFAQELTKRYGTNGTYWGCLLPGLLCRRPYKPILAYQVWNEPDIIQWWRTGVNPAQYNALLAAAYRGLKAGDPKAEVVIAGLTIRVGDAGGYLEQLYNLGAAPYFDTMALHAYGGNISGVTGVIRKVRNIMIAKGDGATPMRITEYGFATGGVREWVATPTCQAALIYATTRELVLRKAELGLKAINQFQWRDATADPTLSWPNYAGMHYFDRTPKPSLTAYTEAVAGRPPPAGQTVPLACPSQFQG